MAGATQASLQLAREAARYKQALADQMQHALSRGQGQPTDLEMEAYGRAMPWLRHKPDWTGVELHRKDPLDPATMTKRHRMFRPSRDTLDDLMDLEKAGGPLRKTRRTEQREEDVEAELFSLIDGFGADDQTKQALKARVRAKDQNVLALFSRYIPGMEEKLKVWGKGETVDGMRIQENLLTGQEHKIGDIGTGTPTGIETWIGPTGDTVNLPKGQMPPPGYRPYSDKAYGGDDEGPTKQEKFWAAQDAIGSDDVRALYGMNDQWAYDEHEANKALHTDALRSRLIRDERLPGPVATKRAYAATAAAYGAAADLPEYKMYRGKLSVDMGLAAELVRQILENGTAASEALRMLLDKKWPQREANGLIDMVMNEINREGN